MATLADWIHDHALTAGTLDPRAPLDDLAPLADVIGTARVVGIGESAHHAREFHLLRHRLLRLLVERHGFTVLAFEAPFTEAHTAGAWVCGGPGEPGTGGWPGGLGDPEEIRGILRWMRDHNRTAAVPVRFAGTTVPGRAAAVEVLTAYLRTRDPDALPLIAGIARLPPQTSIFKTFQRYAAAAPAERDAVTAAISRLLCRMETMSAPAEMIHHVRGLWYGDHTLRDYVGCGIAAGTSPTDAYLAESVLRLLDVHQRIVLAVHNCHLRKTAVEHEGASGLFPAGHHLAAALGDDYLAIAVTGGDGRIAQVRPDPRDPRGFAVVSQPPAPLTGANIESAFTGGHPLSVADLRAARASGVDSAGFQRMRMENYHTDVDVFAAYDVVAHISRTGDLDGG